MAIRTVFSNHKDTSLAFKEISNQFSSFSPQCILFFASYTYPTEEICVAMKTYFPNCEIFGATSHSEFIGNLFLDHSIVAMAFDSGSILDMYIQVILHTNLESSVHNAIIDYENYFGDPNIDVSINNYVGLILFDGNTKCEEIIMDKLGNETNLFFVGGSASSDNNDIPGVFYNGKFYSSGTLLCMFKVTKGFNIFKTQSVELFSSTALTVTKADSKARIIYEFNGRPARDVYAEILDVPIDEINQYFFSNPLGVLVGDETFIRTLHHVKGDAISTFCGINEGTDVYVLKMSNIIESMQKGLDSLPINSIPQGIINFNCLYRTLELKQNNMVPNYCNLFTLCNSIGFSTFGEAFLGFMNATSTVLAIY
ncbi:MAG: FIST signal transduction protein [Cellulosilyticaceae bacterium]